MDCKVEEAAALRGNPTPGNQQVSENHTHHRESKPLMENKSGKANGLQRADRDQ
jgi:hypothetical protein